MISLRGIIARLAGTKLKREDGKFTSTVAVDSCAAWNAPCERVPPHGAMDRFWEVNRTVLEYRASVNTV